MIQYGNGNKIIKFYGIGNNFLKQNREKYVCFMVMVTIKPNISVMIADSYYSVTL